MNLRQLRAHVTQLAADVATGLLVGAIFGLGLGVLMVLSALGGGKLGYIEGYAAGWQEGLMLASCMQRNERGLVDFGDPCFDTLHKPTPSKD